MTAITIVGNLADDPTTRPVSEGKTVTTFVVLESRRVQVAGEWSDADPNRFEVEVWDQLASNAAELRKGDPVIVMGKIVTKKWTVDDSPRSRQVVRGTAVGFSLARHTVAATKNEA